MLKNLAQNHNKKITRLIEITIGVVVWATITAPIWAIILIPQWFAIIMILVTLYWFYKSLMAAIMGLIGYKRMEDAKRIDWYRAAEKLHEFNDLYHAIIIPNYKESTEKLRLTLDRIKNQTFPPKRILLVLAIEAREGKPAQERAQTLQSEYGPIFYDFLITQHPDVDGEVKGKSSNMAWAGKKLKEYWTKQKKQPLENITVTSCDADALLPKDYLSYFSYEFLNHPKRYRRFWQSILVEYSNIWRVPLPIRLVAAITSVIRIAALPQQATLIPYSTYSASLKLIDDGGYWDVDVIPEDWHLFFKCFFRLGGNVETEPLYQTVTLDAIEGDGFFDTMRARWDQSRRHAWGVTDIPYIVQQWLLHPEIPFWRKTYRLIHATESHFLWSTSWFLLTLGVNVAPLLNRPFQNTVLGANYPPFARIILLSCFIFTIVFIGLDMKMRPKPIQKPSIISTLAGLLQWIIMPIITLFLSTLPGLDAHTRLMMNRRIEYKVTKKKVGNEA